MLYYRIKLHDERQTTRRREDVVPDGAVPAYLLDRSVWLGHSVGVAVYLHPLSVQGGAVPCQGAKQHDQAEEKGEGC